MLMYWVILFCSLLLNISSHLGILLLPAADDDLYPMPQHHEVCVSSMTRGVYRIPWYDPCMVHYAPTSQSMCVLYDLYVVYYAPASRIMNF